MSVILVREGVIMKIGIVGSRNLVVSNLDEYVLEECTEIISGGAIGVDKCAADYAKSKNILLTEILPEYQIYGKGAPLIRNKVIVEKADMIIAFWDEKSNGTKFVIDYANKLGKPCKVITIKG